MPYDPNIPYEDDDDGAFDCWEDESCRCRKHLRRLARANRSLTDTNARLVEVVASLTAQLFAAQHPSIPIPAVVAQGGVRRPDV